MILDPAHLHRYVDQAFLETLDEREREHLAVLFEAFFIFQEREQKYHGLWREGGWTDSAHHIRSKGARVGTLLNGVASLSDAELYLDDAHDGINFNAFFVQNVRAARAKLPREADGVKDKDTE